jgi:ankyrin repeat protein
MASSMSMNETGASPSSGGAVPTTGDFVDLHELSKGWKAAITRAKDPSTRYEARVKNDRGNLPLHSAASFRAPLEVAEALLAAYPEAASITNNYGNLALHFTAWKKGPLDVEQLLLKVFPQGAAQKNNHGNLPLHYAAHYNAPLEVVEALFHAYPEGALQKNNDNNTPLDLAIADGASPNVVALLQGQSVPPTDEEVLDAAKSHCERMEKELQRSMEQRDGMTEEREMVLAMLMDMKENHPHALYSAGIDPKAVTDLDSMLEQVRKASVEETIPPGSSDEEIDAQLIEESLCPPDDPVEVALAGVIGCSAVKNQIRGLRRTIEIAAATGEVSKIPRHLAFIGNPGTGKTMVARKMVNILRNVGAIQSLNFVEVGREDLIDKKSEARTVFKTRKVLERAAGGVLFVDEAYTLLPSTARPRGRDHGAAALREIARALPGGNPLVILTGAPLDLQRVLSSDIGFKGHFLTRIEFPDATPLQIAHMFMAKLSEKGLMPAQGVTPQYLGELIKSNTEAEWRQERNGRIADLLLLGVRAEVKKRAVWDDTASKGSLSPMKILSPGSSRMPAFAPEEVFVNVEDIQNAIVNGM